MVSIEVNAPDVAFSRPFTPATRRGHHGHRRTWLSQAKSHRVALLNPLHLRHAISLRQNFPHTIPCHIPRKQNAVLLSPFVNQIRLTRQAVNLDQDTVANPVRPANEGQLKQPVVSPKKPWPRLIHPLDIRNTKSRLDLRNTAADTNPSNSPSGNRCCQKARRIRHPRALTASIKSCISWALFILFPQLCASISSRADVAFAIRSARSFGLELTASTAALTLFERDAAGRETSRHLTVVVDFEDRTNTLLYFGTGVAQGDELARFAAQDWYVLHRHPPC